MDLIHMSAHMSIRSWVAWRQHRTTSSGTLRQVQQHHTSTGSFPHVAKPNASFCRHAHMHVGADGTHAHMVQPSASSSQRKYERARTSACHNRTCVHACAHAAIHSPGTLSFGRNICGETCMQHACLRVRTCVCRQVLCHQLKQGRRLGNKTGWPVVNRVGLRRTAPADANRF